MSNLPYTGEKAAKISKARLINEPLRLKPHVVILGAGASKQAFPQGDANGKKLPVMDELVEVVGLQPILKEYKIHYERRNFESLYSELYKIDSESSVLKAIEEKIRAYFTSLEIPNEPTLFDHLLLCLRPKDVVATFNWDPFLFDTWDRNRYKAPLPDILHLHGNVRIGYCKNHQVQGENGRYCPECNKKLTPSRLLYPVDVKNYSDDYLISSEWKVLKHILRDAFTITIFGYGAPTTDKEAVELLEKAWKDKSKRELETTEFIDIKDEDVIREQWEPFIYSHHYLHFKEFYKSWIPNHPRRSCEALYVPTALGRFVDEFPLPKNLGFDEILSWLNPLIEAEHKLKKSS